MWTRSPCFLVDAGPILTSIIHPFIPPFQLNKQAKLSMDIAGPGSDNANGTTPQMLPPFTGAPAHNYGGIRLVASIWVLSAVALVFLTARCYCKFLRHMRLWWDDGILIAAWVCHSHAGPGGDGCPGRYPGTQKGLSLTCEARSASRLNRLC